MTAIPLWLANRAVHAGTPLALRDVWTGETIVEVAQAGPDEIERAITAAHAARPAMAALPGWRRRDALDHLRQRIAENAEALAQTIRAEGGKPITAARAEVARAQATLREAAAEAGRLDGQTLDLDRDAATRGWRGLTRRVPAGVASLVTPFNFPLNLVVQKLAPALAAGCPVLLKPAPATPLSALALGEWLAECDLPEGAFSILPCTNAHAAPLVEDERIAVLSFTGGLIGWELKARAGKKRVVLELGGNAACIVDADPGAPLDHVAARIVAGACGQAGQSCISVQRLIVHREVWPALRDKLVDALRALPQGDPRDPRTIVGPMISAAAAHRLDSSITSAMALGATALVRGTRDEAHPAFLGPTLLENVPRDHPLYRDEAFGPVLMVEAAKDFAQAIERANDSRFGLQCGVFTARMDHAMRAWDALDVGGVVIGDVPTVRVDRMPYGGVKDSGLGREGPAWAIDDFSELRLMVWTGDPAR
ncbi:aldehyde dehydrogenase family protein [Silanimonas sp.]|uniref:aldehyde dehydrogenase family protein n=1 Tax=Silanimonas sp. TaxID=1929290 RepID=UPI0022C728DC|nr:aldehyde dehydrogenase family protein [Silanimonas sp.]MCZ8166196.1 aldehyde dehydrogenase family protein [Silanimonas sp.]